MFWTAFIDGNCSAPLHECLIHVARVLAHYLGEFIPLRLLGRSDLELPVQFLDVGFRRAVPRFCRPPACPAIGEALRGRRRRSGPLHRRGLRLGQGCRDRQSAAAATAVKPLEVANLMKASSSSVQVLDGQ